MTERSRRQRLLRLALAAGVMLAALDPGFAQPPAPQPPATLFDPPAGGEDRVVVTGMAPVPDVGEGAPYYAPADIKDLQEEARETAIETEQLSRLCDFPNKFTDTNMRIMLTRESEAAREASDASVAARNATVAAEDARRKFPRGEATQKQVEDAELARQAAVKFFETKRVKYAEAKAATGDYMWLKQRNVPAEHIQLELGRLEYERRKEGFPKAVKSVPELADLMLANLSALPGEDKEGAFIQVTGYIVNPRKAAIPMPAVTFTAVDGFGWALDSRVAERKYAPEIPPGGAAAFNYVFRDAPRSAETVSVTFATSSSRDMRLPVRMFDECNESDEASNAGMRPPRMRQ